MPCYDARGDEEHERNRRKVDALTAILCGLNKSDSTQSWADAWCVAHARVDVLRAAASTTEQWRAVSSAQADADKVLDAAYEVLCQ